MNEASAPLTAGHLGSEGSYSHSILERYFAAQGAKAKLVGFPSNREIARAVNRGDIRYGVLPIDNVVSGTFRDGYDLIAQYALHPVRELVAHMDHRLLAPAGATLATLRTIEGHPAVLEECGRFLSTLAAAKLSACVDVGESVRRVAASNDVTHGVIAGPHNAARHGLVELASKIADIPANTTRFLLVEGGTKDTWTKPSGSPRRTSIVFRLKNESGALLQCLAALADAGVNASKIESRPHTQRPWELCYYLDIDADAANDKVRPALQKIQDLSADFRVLGSYDYTPLPSPSFSGQEVTSGQYASLLARPRPPASVAPPPPAAAKNWPKVARAEGQPSSVVTVGRAELGGHEFIVIAGPCSVESREQVNATAKHVAEHGALLLRGGAFKPRTHPYAFQGLGWDAIDLLKEAGDTYGMPIVSEVMSVDQVERMEQKVDVLQIGARNMQNFDLLKAVGRTRRAILLKRGMSATLDEFLAAAEYILAEGNPNVILCERGIRTFETATRNTLDLSAVPVLRERTHLPVIVDPSHGVGVRRWIAPLARAAKAVGAHGIIVEVHPNPPEAKSDADQALRFDHFTQIMSDLAVVPSFID